MKLAEKTALITGATGKIGQTVVRTLTQQGVHCACHYHRQEAVARSLAEEAKQNGCRALAVGADLRQEDQIRDMFSQVGQWRPIDLLIQTAALFEQTPADAPDPQQARDLLHVNLAAPIFLSGLFAQSLALRKEKAHESIPRGKIICFTDASSERPWKRYSVYCASKAGLAAAVKSMAKELAPNITVNAVAPGIVAGSLTEAEENRRLKNVPTGRFPSVEEIAEAVLFLLKNDSITGRNLVIDGGSSL